MPQLHDRVALVTGAGRGIGRAVALALAAEGARVAVSARTTAELDEVVGLVEKRGGQALALSADLSDRTVPARIVAQVKQAWGPIEILVNNAGVGSTTIGTCRWP
jgi:NAD(P)-dependent dehydrogenase (short-subunit alcohol dehydrogenase family)